MGTRIATTVLLFLLLVGSAHSGEEDFAERFALADGPGRERLLMELVVGTDEHFYFHCLHYQNTRNTAALRRTLAAWQKSGGDEVDDPFGGGLSPLRMEIELREALYAYPQQREESLQTLRDHFELDLDEIVPPAGASVAQDDLPSRLDPKLITDAAFVRELLDPQRDFLTWLSADTAAWLIATKQELPKGAGQRDLLKRIDRPDVPGLLKLVADDLGKVGSGAFGSMEIHRLLTLEQLDALAKLIPQLRANRRFAKTYLSKLQPSAMEPGSDAEKREIYLGRAWKFAKGLPPAMAEVQAFVLRHWLALDLEREQIDRDRLVAYLKLVRRGGFANPEFLKIHKHRYLIRSDLAVATGLPELPKDDEPLVRAVLLALFRTESNTGTLAKYLRAEWLREVVAEAQLLAGKGDRERLVSALTPARYQELVERVEIKLAPGNPGHQAAEEGVKLAVDVKNVPKLAVRVFELNAFNYLLETKRDLDLSIDLDGLVATAEKTYEYGSPPALRVRREFEFPELAGKRGAWLIEFVGNGTSSRALIRKGELHAIPTTTVAGQIIRVFDEKYQRVPGASLWFAGHEFRPDEESGDILVPFSINPKRAQIILSDGDFSVLDSFDHEGENYEFKVGVFIDRESLTAGNTAQLIARPALTINAAPADLNLLQGVALTITAIAHDGTRSVDRSEGITLEAARELVHEFVVPEHLAKLEVRIDAEVESLSTQQRIPLLADHKIELNGITKTDVIQTAHLIKSGDGYVVEVLGRNGEPAPGQPVLLEFTHASLEMSLDLKFRTDEKGRVVLGKLENIRTLQSQPPLPSHPWILGEAFDAELPVANAMHLAAGQAAIIPLSAGKPDLDWQNYSLLEMRGGLPARNRFDALSVDDDGSLKMAGLPPGDYRLRTPRHTMEVRVATKREGPILVAPEQFLEPSRQRLPLGLAIEDPADGKLRLRVKNAGKGTRVHVVASRYVPQFPFNWALADPIDRTPRSLSVVRAQNAFHSGREIGDEYRYILERRERKRFPGNLLPRPGLLLNPWDLSESYGDEILKKGFGGGVAGSLPGRMRPSKRDSSSYVSDVQAFSSLDFLKPQRRTFYNLRPDEHGIVEIDIAELGGARFLRAAAIDDPRRASQSRALPEVRLESRDRRLQKLEQLDPRGRFTLAREVEVIGKDKKLTIGRANSARFQIYDNLGDAFALLSALGGDDVLEKFAFITGWPKLEEADKRRYYSDYACHELDVFLAHRDLAFFESVVEPYLENKRSKGFIDHYLLGHDLRGYLDEWRLLRLNAAERALLAQTLMGEDRERCVRSLVALHESKLVDHTSLQRLFEAALAGNDLSVSDEAFAFNEAMEAGLIDDAHSGLEFIRRPLKAIIIPQIDFTDATLEEAIDFLRRQSKEHDVTPSKQGVNIVIDVPRGVDGLGELPLINLVLNEVPLEDALKFVTQLAGLKYKVEPNAVVIVPAFADDSQLVTKTYRVPPDFLEGRSNARDFLMEVGVPFPEGAMATYLERDSTLVVRNTEANLDLIDVFTDSLSISGDELGPVVPGDDPFAAGGDDSSGDDPFGGSVWESGSSGLAARKTARQFYRKLDDTEELAETHYYQLPIGKQTADHIKANAFWRDFASWDGEGVFLSENFAEAHSNFSEIMLALALLELPFDSEPVTLAQRGNELTLTAKSPKIVFAEQIREAALAEGDVVIGQKFFPLAQPTRLERGERVPNYIEGDGLVIGTGYGSDVVVTNPTGRAVQFDLLRQIPHGAMPLNDSRSTHGQAVKLKPYSTKNFALGFYFPMAGKFGQYPGQASVDGRVAASTVGKTFLVKAEPGAVDKNSWDDLARRGSGEAVIEFLGRANLNLYDLREIAWRMVDKQFFGNTIAVLRERQIYHHEIYSFGLAHDHPHAIRQFLLNSSGFLKTIGGAIESELLAVDPEERRLYQHLEYAPLINARRHPLGDRPRITNEQFDAQLARSLELLRHKPEPDAADRLSIVYYLLLQERIGEAIAQFDQIDRGGLATRLQYDYFRSYLAFYREDAKLARQIAVAYKDYPVERWRQAFAQVVSQADEVLRAVEGAVDDPRDREQQQARLADSSPGLDLKVEGKTITVTHRNLGESTLNFYKMDLEFLFSANPFVEGDTTRFRFVKPNLSKPLRFEKNGGAVQQIELPAEYHNSNVLVEVVGGGQNKAQAYFANSLDVKLATNYGRLTVTQEETGRPLPKSYVKVFARMRGGEVKFYKDGYTDLRGKFDYASLSATDPHISEVVKFAILVMHEEFGAVVKATDAPAR